ncbi:hypothetical protein D3C78_492560 [compost metagenome]
MPEQLIGNRQHDRADKQTNDAPGDHAAQCADQHHRHRYIDTTPQQQWLEDVIDQACDKHKDGKHNGPGSRTVSGEGEDDHRNGNQGRWQLHDAQQQYRQGQQACTGNALEYQAGTHQQHLNEGDTDHTQRHCANGGGAQYGDARAPVRAANARNNAHRAPATGLAIGHEDPRDDQGEDENQEAHAGSGKLAQQREAEALDFGDVLLYQQGQVVGGLHPQGIQGFAYQWPTGKGLGWWWNLNGIALDDGDGTFHRVHQGRTQQIDRHHQDGNGDQYEQGGGVSAAQAQSVLELDMQWIESDCQDDRPQHQIQERTENAEAEHRQNGE